MKTCPYCGAEYEGDVCPRCALDAGDATTTFTPVGLDEVSSPSAVSHGDNLSLTVVKGPQMGDTFALEGELTTIGRDTNADIFLNDRTVSREHAEISVDGSNAFLRDLNSLNGTYVDGHLVESTPLKNGSVIQIGTFQLQFIEG